MIVWQIQNGLNGQYVVSKNGRVETITDQITQACKYVIDHAANGDFISVSASIYL